MSLCYVKAAFSLDIIYVGLGPECSTPQSSADLIQVTPAHPSTHYIHFNIILSSQTPSITLPYSCSFFFREDSILWVLSAGCIILLDVTKLTVRKSERKSPRLYFVMEVFRGDKRRKFFSHFFVIY
jgi:hypothetical protein